MSSNAKFVNTSSNSLRRAPMTMNLSERFGGLQAMGRLSSISANNRNYNAPLSSDYLNQSSYPTGMYRSQMEPPPLPPRQDQGIGSGYMRSPAMRSCYNPYSPYSSGLYSPAFRGGFGSYGSFGAPHDPYNSFIQLAEESSRPTFQTIESVVEVFSSISMMLESTYHAVHSSYSAILGVVDQFSRLKDHVAQVLSILTLLRSLRWLCLKVLYLLRLRKENPSVEAAWRSAQTAARNASSGLDNEKRNSSWPFFMFLGLVVGAPWLMFKLLAKSVEKTFDSSDWIRKDGKCYIAQSLYDFRATRSNELSFQAGEKLCLSPKGFCHNKPQNWLLACNDAKETGLVPANYLRIKVTKPLPSAQNAPVPSSSAVGAEDIPLSNNSPLADLPFEASSSQMNDVTSEDLPCENLPYPPKAALKNLSGVPSRSDSASFLSKDGVASSPVKHESVEIESNDLEDK